MDENIASFMNKTSLLATTYGKLVAIEIALRNESPFYSHDVPSKLQGFGSKPGHNTGFYNVNSNTLATALSQIFINSKPAKMHKNPPTSWTEIISNVPSHSYPYMRYARLSSDYTNSSVTQSNLTSLDRLLDQIIFELRKDGVIK
ncbi:hypothetical protein [Aeromonas veronii]|uniref:hypothetical protein n=1 Tax=Aeromonas veronii TaxID=654 RepID=UPI001268AE5B|nr:hypothetical protein [Aeromonas veronii]QMS76690.1 hypothetical protein M001_000505 [Aeromonas veronii Hm21]